MLFCRVFLKDSRYNLSSYSSSSYYYFFSKISLLLNVCVNSARYVCILTVNREVKTRRGTPMHRPGKRTTRRSTTTTTRYFSRVEREYTTKRKKSRLFRYHVFTNNKNINPIYLVYPHNTHYIKILQE